MIYVYVCLILTYISHIIIVTTFISPKQRTSDNDIEHIVCSSIQFETAEPFLQTELNT